MGILRIRIQEIPSFGIYQITTGSFNSIVNINSFIRDLCEFCIVNGVDVSQVRLVLKRTGQQVQRLEGGKVKKSKHHIMSIDLDPRFYKSLDDVRIRALQSRMPPVPKALPPADETKDDLFFQEQGGGFDASEEALRETISGLNEGQKIIDATKAEAKKLGVTIIDEIAKKKPEQKTSGIHDLGTEQGFPEGPPNGEPMKLTQDEPKKVKPKPPDEKAPLRAAFAALVKAGGIIPKDECNKFAGAMTKKDIDYWTKVLNDRTAYLRRIAKG